MTIEIINAEVVEVDADVAGDAELRIPSLWQLGEKARHGDALAKAHVIVAAAALTAGEYPLASWWIAYIDLQQELGDRRLAFRRRLVKASLEGPELHDALTIAHQLADAEFLSEIDHAVRRWEESQ